MFEITINDEQMAKIEQSVSQKYAELEGRLSWTPKVGDLVMDRQSKITGIVVKVSNHTAEEEDDTIQVHWQRTNVMSNRHKRFETLKTFYVQPIKAAK